MQPDQLVRESERRTFTGIPTSSWYDLVTDGLAPPAVKLTKHTSAWPFSELIALNAARIAGKSDDEIRKLVKRVVAARDHAFDGAETA